MTHPQANSETSSGPDFSAAPTLPSSEVEFRTQVDRDTEINRELRRLNRALRALSACNQALSQASSEQELLDQICDIIVRLGAYRFAWIGYALHDAAKSVRPMAHAGHEADYLNQIIATWSEEPSGKGPTGTAIRENSPSVVVDTQADPRFAPWREAALARGYSGMIALPLCAAGSTFGALAIYSDQKGSFEASEVDLLQEMANNLAFGITAIRSREDGKRTTAALRDAEAKYRQLVEQVPAISYVAEAGAQGRFLYVSPQVTAILGYTQEDVSRIPASGGIISTRPTTPWPGWKTPGKWTEPSRWNTACAGKTGRKSGCAMKRSSSTTPRPESE